ncbi:MAG: DUF4349 domain-containing protein [Leptospiraceae bacterium]|nr:DUF4349 domain-containing protein [Leptospiraceae bacterium]MCP5511603.1 DUF4349 domain-containing protein [Leptospiraceae bacterium]
MITTENEKFDSDSASNTRYISYTGSISIRIPTSEKEEKIKSIRGYIEGKKGYIQREDLYSLTVKIPATEFFSLMDYLKTLGELESRSINAKDITEEYIDTGIRLENARKLQTRLLDLLAKAKSISDTLEIEKELNRVTNTVDTLQGKMNYFKNIVNFSEVSIYLLKPKTQYGPIGYVFYWIGSGVEWLFVRGEE